MRESAMPLRTLAEVDELPDVFDPFSGGAIERVYASSEAQREVWFADRLGREASLAFNESVRLTLLGRLDRGALERALNALLARHESLRATFSADGTEVLIGAAAHTALPCHALQAASPAAAAEALREAADAAVRQPFDLQHGPLFRAELYRVADGSHVLLMTAHHIVCDGWSWGVVVEDLGGLYAEQVGEAPGPEPAPAYGDYVHWEAQTAASPEMDGHRHYWRGQFAGSALPVLQLPTDLQRPAVRRFESVRVDHMLDAALLGALRKLGGAEGASIFATLYTGFAALLARLTGQDDLVIGVPSAGQSASGMNRLVGHCVNLLPVRTRVDAGVAFAQLLRTTAAQLLDAFDHQTLTYGSLLKELTLPRDASRLPLVSVMFNVDPALATLADAFPGLTAELSGQARRYENFELFVNAVLCADGVRLECQYSSALFDAVTVERWLRLYETLLRSAVADAGTPVDRLRLVDGSDLLDLRRLQRPVLAMPAEALMHAAVVRQCAATPHRTAVQCGAESLSYAELDERSNRLAQVLRQRGIGRGARVGICLPRGVDMVAALLGVLKAGGAYVPLDPGFPAQRLAYYAKDAQLALMLTATVVGIAPRDWRADAGERVLLLDGEAFWTTGSADALAPSAADPQATDAAYVIYTSGSTGTPKGVEVPHGAVANFLQSMARAPGIDADDRLAAVTTLSFDIAVLELLLPLCVGARSVLVSRDAAMDAQLLSRLLASSGATMMQATPGVWRMLIEADWVPPPGFRALVGGESLSADLAAAMVGASLDVWNLYGPTETTVWSTVWRLDRHVLRERGVAIGRPIDNTTVWVLDAQGDPCAIGLPGELCIGGAGVATGYVGQPELTAERFVPDQWTAPSSHRDATGSDADIASAGAARLYRTGDRARWRNDGCLEHLGRLDNQVKVRGYRIELGEVEAACEALDGIHRCVVVAPEFGPGDVRLVAYLRTDRKPQRGWSITLREELAARLPDYMLPQHVVTVDAWPLLPNGKLDRSRLPDPRPSAGAADAPLRQPPNTPTQVAVAAAMQAVLNLPDLSLDDDFFRLGGHSLLAARLVARLNQSLGLQLPLRTVFEASTIATLATAIDGRAAKATLSPRPACQFNVHAPEAPLSDAQEHIRFVEQLHPGSLVYNTPSGHRLRGPMQATVFEAAFRAVVQRQPALRTRIQTSDQDGGPVQVVDAAPTIDFAHHDLGAVPVGEREAELCRQMQALVDQPMDIGRAPLFRAALYRLSDSEHAFLFMPHRIVFDGWSFDVFYDEMAALYGAMLDRRPDPLPPLAATYADFARWQALWIVSPGFEEQLGYWRQRLASIRLAPPIRADRWSHDQRPERPESANTGATELLDIGPAMTQQLRALATRCDATLNMVTMAAFAAVVAGLADGDAVSIGVQVRGRPFPEFDNVMGNFGNMLPVALSAPPTLTFGQLTAHVKAELLDMLSNQDVPFGRLRLDPDIARSTQASGPYHAVFSHQDARDRQRLWGNLRHETIVLSQKGATADLGIWLMELPDRIEGGLIYDTALFRRETATAIRDKFVDVLERVIGNPDVAVQSLTTDGPAAATQWLHRRKTPIASVSEPTFDQTPAHAVAPAAAAAAIATAGRRAELTVSELALASIWAKLLHTDAADIRPSDGFFDIGGDSLLAMRAIDQAARQLGVRVEPRRYVFETLAQLASDAGRTAPVEANDAPSGTRGAFSRVVAAFKRRGGRPAP